MKPDRWACSSISALALAVLTGAAPAAQGPPAVQAAQATQSAPSAQSPPSAPVEPARAEVILSPQADAPAPDDPRWSEMPITRPHRAGVVWYRVRFDADSADGGRWMLYLPYFYGGGRVWLNGTPVAQVTENSPRLRVRWERPLLLPLPAGALHTQGNVLMVRAAAAYQMDETMLPRIALGPQAKLEPRFERRLFIVRTVPVLTVVAGAVVGLLVMLIWLQRRDEVLYGLFGMAALLWALRTTTFVFDALPPPLWDAWRVVYLLSTGDFVIVMALFTLALAGWSRPAITRTLFGYWALGPVVYLLGGENVADRWWVAGLVPVGLGLALVAFAAAWRQRSAATVSIAAAIVVAFIAGVHDYLVAWSSPLIAALLPAWSQERYFLLHHAANLLLVVMGTLLALRFVHTLGALDVADDGGGEGGARPAVGGGRGHTNMRSRAQRLGGSVEITIGNGGTHVSLRVPMAGVGGAVATA
jgi:hypothetical protein